MSIADKLTTIAENEQKVYDSGREMGRGDMWDTMQSFGNRKYYAYGFCYCSGVNFSPKYAMQPTTCEAMFDHFAHYDTETADLRGIDIDTSKSTKFDYMFNFAKVSAFGTLDTTGATSINNLLYNATVIHTIKLILKADGSQTYNATNIFRSCSALVNLEVEGKFGSSFSLAYSTKLSKDSLYSVFNALLDTASGKTITLPSYAVNKAFETSEGALDGRNSAEWQELIATKPNWTVALG